MWPEDNRRREQEAESEGKGTQGSGPLSLQPTQSLAYTGSAVFNVSELMEANSKTFPDSDGAIKCKRQKVLEARVGSTELLPHMPLPPFFLILTLQMRLISHPLGRHMRYSKKKMHLKCASSSPTKGPGLDLSRLRVHIVCSFRTRLRTRAGAAGLAQRRKAAPCAEHGAGDPSRPCCPCGDGGERGRSSLRLMDPPEPSRGHESLYFH